MILKRLVCASFILLAGVVHAQLISDFGAHLFLGQNDLVGKFQENEKARGLYSFTPGLQAEIDLPAHFTIRTELNFLSLVDSLTWKKTLINAGIVNATQSRIKSSRSYIQVPLILRFQIPAEETKVQLNVGLYGGYLLYQKETGSLINTFAGTPSVEVINSKTYYNLNRWEWGYVFSVSGTNELITYEFRFTKSAVPLFANSLLYPKYNFGYMIGFGRSFN